MCGSPPWSDLLDRRLERPRARVHSLAVYADSLPWLAGADVEAWTTTYLHRLTGPDPVLAWMSGTGLRPVLTTLEADPAAAQEFLEAYRAMLREAYPPDRAGATPMPFRRLFVVARV